MLTTSEQANCIEAELDPSFSHLEGWGENVADTLRVIQELRQHPPSTILTYWARDAEGKLCFGVKVT